MDKRNKIIKARVTEREETLVKAKAEHYGYKNLSKYIIDSAIYEKVTNVDVSNQDKIYDAYVQNTQELKKIVKEIKHICKFATQLDEVTVKSLKTIMFNIIDNQKAMLSLIDTKLDLDVWQQINHFKNLEE